MSLAATAPTRTPRTRRLRALPWAACLALTFGVMLSACNQNSCPAVDPTNEQPVVPMTPAQAPMIMTTYCNPNPFQNSCGGETWQVNFVLPQNVVNSGWVVQQVTANVNASNPDGTMPAGGNSQATWWEAYYIAQNQATTMGIYKNPDGNYDDKFQLLSWPNTSGMQSLQGIAEFYEGTLPSDFVRRAVQSAGCLRSTSTQPDFWTGVGTPHNLTTSWDCTNGNADAGVQSVPPDCQQQ